MITQVYFIRHAEPDYSNHDDANRPLTKRGLRERALVTAYLWDKDIEVVLSSPFVRARDTVADFAARKGLSVVTDADFRERAISNEWIDDWDDFNRRQWQDHHYKRPHGDSLNETRQRNAVALERAITAYPGKNIVVGSHGTALSMLIHHYDATYGYEDMMTMVKKMPWAVAFTFESQTDNELQCLSIEKTDLTIRPMTTADYVKAISLGFIENPVAGDNPFNYGMVAAIGDCLAGMLLYNHDESPLLGSSLLNYYVAVAQPYEGLGLDDALLGAAEANA